MVTGPWLFIRKQTFHIPLKPRNAGLGSYDDLHERCDRHQRRAATDCQNQHRERPFQKIRAMISKRGYRMFKLDRPLPIRAGTAPSRQTPRSSFRAANASNEKGPRACATGPEGFPTPYCSVADARGAT